MKKLFAESQKFRLWWVWIILLGLAGMTTWAWIQQLILGKPFGDNPMSDTGLLIFTIAMYAFVFLFTRMKLTTRIDAEGIRMRFLPLSEKHFRWFDIESAEVINYGFVGGWGIRFGSEYGVIYNMSGNKGLALKLKNGKKLVIGTRKPKEMEEVVREFMGNEENMM